MKHRSRQTLSVFALSAALWQGAGSAGETIGLWTHVYCPSSPQPCGFSNEEELREAYRAKVGEINLEFRHTGLSFRPDPIFIVYDSPFMAISAPETPADLIAQLDQAAAGKSSVLSMYLIPGLSACWADGGTQGQFSIYCRPGVNATGLAHEMGHQFCLEHTFTFQDPATHDPVSHDGDGLADTRPDPGELEKWQTRETMAPNVVDGKIVRDEDANGVFVPLHDWCNYVTNSKVRTLPPVNFDSPHQSYCIPDCRRTDAGGVDQPSAFSPDMENAMNYYGEAWLPISSCRGPYSVGRDTFEAFSPQQVAKIRSCRDHELEKLHDVCAKLGGDRDGDGWCDDEDLCPDDPDTDRRDSDSDGIPDACDLCPLSAVETGDNEGDGLGDACDSDDDNDGCVDRIDQHPLDAYVPIGTLAGVNCSKPPADLLAFEGGDTDGDGKLDCVDRDDDEDGIPDERDACPTVVGTDPNGCHKTVSCPLQNWWDVCLLGGCDELRVKISSVVNPDPTRDVIFDRFSIDGRTLVVQPAGGTPLAAQIAQLAPEAFDQQAPRLTGAPAAPTALKEVAPRTAERRRIEIVAASTGEVIVTVGEYDTARARIGEPSLGTVIEITPPRSQREQVLFSAGWPTGTARRDGDGDGIPDALDNCPAIPNRFQQDHDRDHVGNACDADLDRNGVVDRRDLAIFSECHGTDLTDPGSQETAEDGLEERIHWMIENVRLRRCLAADLDGDYRVGDEDLARARSFADRSN